MNILLYTSSFLPKIGGAELAVHNLAEGLVKIGHKVTVCTFNWASKNPIANYDLRRIKVLQGVQRLWSINIVQNHLEDLLIKTISEVKPDIIHSHFSIPCGYTIAKIRRKICIPTVLTCHGEDIQKCPEIPYGHRLNPKKEEKIRFALHNTDALVAISSNVHNEYRDLNVEKEKITNIPNSIAYDHLNSESINGEVFVKRENKIPIILAVGRNHPKKGLSNLIKIIRILKDKNIRTKCIVVGKGTSKLNDIVKKLGLEDSVELIKTTLPIGVRYKKETYNPTDLIEYYFKIADIYAMPSLVESFGVVTVEAMAAGKPIVAMRSPGTEDLVMSEQNGFIIENNDLECFAERLIELIKDPLLRNKLGKQGQQFAKTYSAVNVAKQHEELYKKLLA